MARCRPSPVLLKVREEVTARWPQVRDLGICNCRRQRRNPNKWSQHAYGKAWDAGVPDLATGDAIYRYLTTNRVRLGVGKILWRIPDHFNHLHIEEANTGVGTPECAGGSGLTEFFDRPGGAAMIGVGEAINPGGISPTVAAAVGDAAAAPLRAFSSVTDLIGALGDPRTYLRVLWFVGGSIAVIGAGAIVVKELIGVDPTKLVAAIRRTAT